MKQLEVETVQGPIEGSIFLANIPGTMDELDRLDLHVLLRRGKFSGISAESQLAIYEVIQAKRAELLGAQGMALTVEL